MFVNCMNRKIKFSKMGHIRVNQLKLYNMLVNRIPYITRNYQNYRNQIGGRNKIVAMLYLLKLNIECYIFRKHRNVYDVSDCFPSVKLKGVMSESIMCQRKTVEELVQKLAKYDVISFDVFDTLILRPIDKPADLFFLLESKLQYMNFRKIREQLEQEVRKIKCRTCGNGEVTLAETWERIEQECGIDRTMGMELEIQSEITTCFANPYFLEVVKQLVTMQKAIIITSDMYLPSTVIQMILQQSGYPEFTEYLVSCELQYSKHDGSMYRYMKQKYGTNKKLIHVGDNPWADIKQGKAQGIDTYYYPNVHQLGNTYRTQDMSHITGSIYRGLVNTYIHNGLHQYHPAYEFGFIYGGLFVLGYCKWIHAYVKPHNVDKILFLARDGDILKKVYEKLYPEERIAYVPWSRLVGMKLTAKYYKYEYIQRFVTHKVNQGYSIRAIFTTMELEQLLPLYLQQSGESDCTKLTDKNYECVKTFLLKQWKSVIQQYEEEIRYGKVYYQQVLEHCKKVVAVDVGWAGSGAITLDTMVNKEWQLDCEVIGLVAGTNSFHSMDVDCSEGIRYSGKIESYMFSQDSNRDCWKIHNPNYNHNVIVELLLASSDKSFRGFQVDTLKYGETDTLIDAEAVQQGILDFADYSIKRVGRNLHISGRDAFAPIEVLYRNPNYIKQLLNIEDFTKNVE